MRNRLPFRTSLVPPDRERKVWLRHGRMRRAAVRMLNHLVLVTAAVVVVGPFAWLVSTSLKERRDIFLFPPQWMPDPIRWSNYSEALTALPFDRYLLNTLIITGTSMVGQVMSAALVAFAFARLRWPGRDHLFVLVLITMMLPQHVTFIPQFLGFRALGWVDTFWPLIVPAYFGGGPFYVFLLRQFFRTLPREIDDAARLDGTSNFGIFWRITLPLSKPALATVAIFSFYFHWNDFFGPLIYLQDPQLRTLSLGLRHFTGPYGTEWHLIMAASTAVVLPPIVLFFLAQRYFIQGVVFSGLKG